MARRTRTRSFDGRGRAPGVGSAGRRRRRRSRRRRGRRRGRAAAGRRSAAASSAAAAAAASAAAAAASRPPPPPPAPPPPRPSEDRAAAAIRAPRRLHRRTATPPPRPPRRIRPRHLASVAAPRSRLVGIIARLVPARGPRREPRVAEAEHIRGVGSARATTAAIRRTGGTAPMTRSPVQSGPRRPAAAVEVPQWPHDMSCRYTIDRSRRSRTTSPWCAAISSHRILRTGPKPHSAHCFTRHPCSSRNVPSGRREGGAHVGLVLRRRLRAGRRRRRREVLLDRIGQPKVDGELDVLRLQAVEGGGRQHRRQLLQPERNAAAVGRRALDVVALLLLLARVDRRGSRASDWPSSCSTQPRHEKWPDAHLTPAASSTDSVQHTTQVAVSAGGAGVVAGVVAPSSAAIRGRRTPMVST